MIAEQGSSDHMVLLTINLADTQFNIVVSNSIARETIENWNNCKDPESMDVIEVTGYSNNYKREDCTLTVSACCIETILIREL